MVYQSKSGGIPELSLMVYQLVKSPKELLYYRGVKKQVGIQMFTKEVLSLQRDWLYIQLTRKSLVRSLS